MKNDTWIRLVLGWVLVVFAPLPARAQNVFAASNWNSVHSDPQPAVCRIVVTPGGPAPHSHFDLDRTEVRLDHRDGGDQQSVALQGVVTLSGSPFVPSGGQIAIACTSPNGTASDGVITAIQTVGTFNVPPCTDLLLCSTYSLPP
jgi:hypothetical protein